MSLTKREKEEMRYLGTRLSVLMDDIKYEKKELIHLVSRYKLYKKRYQELMNK